MTSLASTVESVEQLRPGLKGIDQAREAIQRKIADGARNEITIRRARELVARAPPWDEEAQVTELFNYFKSPVTGFAYRKDPLDVQHIEAAPSLPSGGDCKKYAAQLGAYLVALGIPVEVVICGQRPPAWGRPPRFHHVYVRALVNGKWIALDPTLHRPTDGVYAEAGDELAHAIERTYCMNGFVAANDTLGQFDFFEAIKAFGREIDPTRTGSWTRGIIQSIPGVGTAAVGVADAVASARKALTTATAPPSEVVTSGSRSLQEAPPPPPPPEKEQKAEKKGGLSAGAVVGGVAAAGVVGGLIYAAVRAGKSRKGRRRRR